LVPRPSLPSPLALPTPRMAEASYTSLGPEDGTTPSRKVSLRLAHVMNIWSKTEADLASKRRQADFFGPVDLAKDGGLGDVKGEKLLYSTQYVYAAMSALFIIMNTIYVTWLDKNCVFHGQCTQVMTGTVEAECIKSGIASCADTHCISMITAACKENPEVAPPFMLVRSILFDQFPSERIIATIEFFGLWYLILRTVQMLVLAIVSTVPVFRWVCVVQIFWQNVPALSCFSLMRLLYYVTPAVIGTEAYYQVTWTMERIKEDDGPNRHNTLPLLKYIVTRLLCAVIGFDAFLVKFRAASRGVMQPFPSALDMFAVVLFLFQVLGVVNLTWFVRERLFLFIFGSENGDMTNEQKARQIVWNAMVARKIWQEFGLFHFLVVMLGFDDYDFQVLAMEGKKTKQVQRPECPKGHALAKRRTPLPQCDCCLKRFLPFTETWGCSRCNFDACDACKFDTSLVAEDPAGDSGCSNVEAWFIGAAIDS